MSARQRLLWWLLAGAGVLWMVTQTGIVDRALSLIKRWEGLSLKAYQDVAGLWTIGYGHLIRPGERFHPYGPVMHITQAEADALLVSDSAAARKAVADAVKVPLSAGERAALESLAFNIGGTSFAGSTLVRKLNAGDRAGAAAEFLRWVHAGGKVVQGLVNRREDERREFLT